MIIDKALNAGVMEMVLESDLASIERVVEETEAFLESRVSDEDLAYRVVLLATEAVTNAIEHGNKFDPSKQVFFRVDVREASIELVIEDQGEGFDPSERDDPREKENLLREGGRGILFMESMADEVEFASGGRKVHLRFYGQ